MVRTFACPEFGQGADAIDGQVTMRDAHGNVKTIQCVKWRDQECNMCRHEEKDEDKLGREPHELHERK